MSIIDKLKGQKPEGPENWIMEQPVGDLFDYLAYKQTKTEKTVTMTIVYLDVKFTITCEEVDANEFAELLKEKMKEL